MNDFNLTLRQKYHALLKGNVIIDGNPVPVYNLFVPLGYPEAYILIQSITSTGKETKNDQDRQFTIQLACCTRKTLNSGYECDSMAGQAMELCYPNRETVIEGCLSTELVSDTTMGDFDPSAKKQIVERFITFSHIITS